MKIYRIDAIFPKLRSTPVEVLYNKSVARKNFSNIEISSSDKLTYTIRLLFVLKYF